MQYISEQNLSLFFTRHNNRLEEDDSRHFHWEILRPQVARDINLAKQATILSNQ